MILAHIAGIPVEEMLMLAPAFAGAGIALRSRLRRERR